MSGVMSTGSERIDAALLDDCPGLKAVCNVGVGCWRRLNLAAPPGGQNSIGANIYED